MEDRRLLGSSQLGSRPRREPRSSGRSGEGTESHQDRRRIVLPGRRRELAFGERTVAEAGEEGLELEAQAWGRPLERARAGGVLGFEPREDIGASCDARREPLESQGRRGALHLQEGRGEPAQPLRDGAAREGFEQAPEHRQSRGGSARGEDVGCGHASADLGPRLEEMREPFPRRASDVGKRGQRSHETLGLGDLARLALAHAEKAQAHA